MNNIETLIQERNELFIKIKEMNNNISNNKDSIGEGGSIILNTQLYYMVKYYESLEFIISCSKPMYSSESNNTPSSIH